MTCPACGYTNHAAAPFCLECGASLSLNNDEGASFAPVAVLPAAPVSGKGRSTLPAMLSPLRWSMEVRIVVALLLLLVGFQFMVNRGVAADSAAYDTARAAMVNHQWHAAANQLAPLAASGFRDASAQLDAAKKQVSAFDANWQVGQKEMAAGDNLQALQSFEAAATIEPTYSGLAAQLTNIRTMLGQMVYRLPTTRTSHGGLWLADADGSNAVQLPGSDANTHIFAVDSDGDRLLYATLLSSPTVANSFSLNFYLYSTRQHVARQFSVPITGTVLFSRNDLIANYQAAFFAGGIVISAGGFGDRSDAPGGFPVWVFGYADHIHEFRAALVARPAATDAAIYFVDSSDAQSNAILSYNPRIAGDQLQQVVGKMITHLYMVGQQLLYSTYAANAVAIYLTAPTTQPLRPLLKLPSAVADITYSNQALYIMLAPDGRSAFITVPNGENYILNLGSGLLYGLSNLPAGGHTSVRFAGFSPDSQHLLIAGGIFYSAMSPSSEGPRYDWIGVSDLSGNIGHVARFNGSIDGAGFLNPDTIYYYRSPGLGGLDNYSEVVVSPINTLDDATPALPNLNLQAAGNWLPYPVSLLDNHTLLLAGKVGDAAGVYALDSAVSSAPVAVQVPPNNGIYIMGTDFIGSSGSIHPLAANATSVWLLKSGQISPAGLP